MILKDHILSLNQLKVCNTHSGVVEGVWSASLSHRQCRGPLRFSLSSSDTWLHSLRVCWASRYRWHRLAWPRSVWVCWSEWVAAKVSGCTCWPSQIDLIKNMGAHLFLWYHERPKWLPWERREEKRREEVIKRRVELMNELLICIEIPWLRDWAVVFLMYESAVGSCGCNPHPLFIRIFLSFQHWPYSRP